MKKGRAHKAKGQVRQFEPISPDPNGRSGSHHTAARLLLLIRRLPRPTLLWAIKGVLTNQDAKCLVRSGAPWIELITHLVERIAFLQPRWSTRFHRTSHRWQHLQGVGPSWPWWPWEHWPHPPTCSHTQECWKLCIWPMPLRRDAPVWIPWNSPKKVTNLFLGRFRPQQKPHL